MSNVRIVTLLLDGGRRSGIRQFPEPMELNKIKDQAWRLVGEVLGCGPICGMVAMEVSASDPEVVALILGKRQKRVAVPGSDGTPPFVKQHQWKPPRFISGVNLDTVGEEWRRFAQRSNSLSSFHLCLANSSWWVGSGVISTE
jgi:hypothetical protein